MTSAMNTTETSNRLDKPRTEGKGWGGGSWIRSSKRWAIYARDGIACVYCGAGYTGPASLTLDHVVCRVNGGNNHESNLVTACNDCNATRKDMALDTFARSRGFDPAAVLTTIKTQTGKALDKVQGQALYAAARAANKKMKGE